MLPNAEDLKMIFLKDVISLHQQIQSFINTTYQAAEDAATHMLSEADILSSAAQSVLILKECRESLALVAAAIPSTGTQFASGGAALSFPLPPPPAKPQVSLATVTYGIPYLVQLLYQGSPDRFWLRLKDTSLDEIETSLKQFYSHAKPSKGIPILGSFVICKYLGKFSRGKVVTFLGHQNSLDKVKVILVDLGEEVEVRPDDIYEMDRQFCKKPAQGLLCSMPNLKPANGFWGCWEILLFTNLCENLVATFHPPPVEEREPFSQFEVDFYVTLQSMKDGKALDIGSELIEKGAALPKTKPLETTATTLLQSEKPSYTYNAHLAHNLDTSLKSFKCEETPKLCQTRKIPPVTTSTPRNTTPIPPSNMPSIHDSNLSLKSSKILRSAVAPTLRNPTPVPPKTDFSSEILNNTMMSSKSGKTLLKPELVVQIEENLRVADKQRAQITLIDNEEVKPATYIADENGDEILDAPPARGEDPPSFFVRPADEMIMQRFLSSLPVPVAPSTTDLDDSFVTAQSASRFESVDTLSTGRESPLGAKCLEYEYMYGANLLPRPLPEIDPSKQNLLTFTTSQIYSPTHFYVLTDNEIAALQELSELLEQIYEDSKPVQVLRPDIDSYWVTRSEIQNTWARARVIRVDEPEENSMKSSPAPENCCYVFFVDFGLYENVRVSSLRPLVSEILDIPCLALRCRMAGIYPYMESPNSENWSEAATEKFKELVLSEAESTALIDPDGSEGQIVSLIYFSDNSEDKYSINELLVGHRLASSTVFRIHETEPEPEPEPAKETPEDRFSTWDPMKDDFLSPKNTIQLDTENYDSVAEGYVPQDEKTICRFFRAQGYCHKGIRCNQFHTQPQPKSFTEDKVCVYIDVPSMPELPIGAMVSLQVTCVMSAFRFYAILPYGARDLRTTFSVLDEEHNLEQLQCELQKEYNERYHQHRYTLSPCMSEIVVARSPQDNKWYRGRVIEENQDDYLGIFFIDYGHRQEVHLSNICRVLPRYTHLPAHAIEMYLNGVERSDDNSSPEAQDALVRLVKERDLVAKILFEIPYVCVDLYDTTGDEQIDVAARLVKEKYVRSAPKMSCGSRASGVLVAG